MLYWLLKLVMFSYVKGQNDCMAPPMLLWIKCVNQGSQSPHLLGSLWPHFMQGSVTWPTLQVAGPATRGLWSQPVLSRVNISWKGLRQQPQGRLGSLRAYTKNRHSHNLCLSAITYMTSVVAQTVKNLPAMQETWVWSLGWKDSLEKGTATYSSILSLENSIDRGAWWATVHGVTKSQTRLSNFHFRFSPFEWGSPLEILWSINQLCPAER